MKIIAASLMMLCSVLLAVAQDQPPVVVVGSLNEQRVSLTQPAVALDGSGAPALEATLRTTALNGAPETPVSNIRMIVKNRSTLPYAFVSGSVTFYDAAGIRCGEACSRPTRWASMNRLRQTRPERGFVVKRQRGASWRTISSREYLPTHRSLN